ncbi:hypothetical protein ACH5RR_018757 [Cinchona calisaya]|uniref:C2 domain-containing protein n=1 Tax=Cinchona calisaya TaxID=153742 RepID=A0ABD2ZSI4_9GENT
MDSEIPTPSTTSTVTASEISILPPAASHILDISLISAQDLAPVSKSMRSYAIIWIHPSRKLTTRVDQQGHKNPLWNDRFAFRVDSEFLSSDQAAITVEIYTVSWFRDVIVGTVRVLISDLITPSARSSTRYVALQIRRPSGNPQGILNMGVALMDATNRSMPLYREMNPLIVDYQDTLSKKMSVQQKQDEEVVPEEDNDNDEVNEKIHLWRSYSVGYDLNEEFPLKAGSVCNGSMINGNSNGNENGNGSLCNDYTGNGSELCSDVGPSASIVAAEILMKSLPPMAERKGSSRPATKAELLADQEREIGSSIVEEMTVEEATAKGLKSNTGRLRKEVSLPPKHEGKYERSKSDTGRRHARRHSDGGLFSCFGNAYGFEVSIVCGASGNGNKPNSINKNRSQKKRFIGSESNSA